MNSIKSVDKTQKRTIKVAYFDKAKRKTKPHRHHNYLEVVVLFEAQGSHCIDDITYPIDGPIAFTIRKDQVHYWDMAPQLHGLVILIKNEFIAHCEDPVIKSLLHKVSQHNCLVPDSIKRLLQMGDMLIETFQEANIHQHIKEGLLKAFLSELLTNSNVSSPKTASINNVYNQFINLLESKSMRSILVADFAKALHTTPQNLTQICQKEQGETANQIIASTVVKEAVRLLLYSEKNIAEITVELGFKDSSHFIKFFKRYKTLTPNQFRLERV